MKYPVLPTCLLMSLLLASCAGGSVSAQDARPEFQLTLKNQEDAVTVLDEDSRTVLDIRSDLGIGAASVELVSGSMPDTLLIRLHLTGLERFRIASAQDVVSASVSTGEVFTITNQSVLHNSMEVPIGSLHPLWMQIRTVPHPKNDPPGSGYFEIVISNGFLRKAGNSFEIQWIDFFR